MKKTTTILLVLFCFSSAIGQADQGAVSTSYDRSSLTVLFVNNDSEAHWNQVKNKLNGIEFSDKYNDNNLQNLIVPNRFKRKLLVDLQEDIDNYLNSNHIGREIVGLWYNRKPDGTMDMDRVHERGRFTATDADFLLAQTSKRGNAALEEFGNRLINLSYVLVIDLANIKDVDEEGDGDAKGWTAKATGYLYKIDFNEEVKSGFYDTWIYDDDSKVEKDRKIAAFNALDIPLKPVLKKVINLRSSQSKESSGLGIFVTPKSVDELLMELVQKSYDETIFQLEKSLEEFKVITPLYSTKPIRAKIGLKEGLKTDYRFYVYEYVYNEKTGGVKARRRGVIRASSKRRIVDNRQEASGDMGTSRFYQISGRKLEEGFLLKQQNDKGIEVSLGAALGEVGGFYGRLDVRMGRFVGISSAFVYLEGGVDGKYYASAHNFLNTTEDNFLFYRYEIGLAKGIHLFRNIEIRPYAGVGFDNAYSSEFETGDAPSAIYVKPGADLALNLIHNLQLVGGVGAYFFISNAESKNEGELPHSWSTIFENRKGLSTYFGIRIGF